MEAKFACQHCGKCCSRVSLDAEPSQESGAVKEFPSFAKNGYVLFCHKPTLSLFDWEAERLEELAKVNGRKLTLVPYKAVYDLKTKTAIILQYTFLEKDCPFHISNRCTIYQDRPFICRSFPVFNGGLAELNTNKLRIKVSGCPNDLDRKDWEEFCERNKSKLQFVKAQVERYGPSYLAKLESDRMLIDIESLLREMIDANVIEAAEQGYDAASLFKIMEQSRQVPLTQFLIETGYKDAESIQELVRDMRELRWSHAMIEKWLGSEALGGI